MRSIVVLERGATVSPKADAMATSFYGGSMTSILRVYGAKGPKCVARITTESSPTVRVGGHTQAEADSWLIANLTVGHRIAVEEKESPAAGIDDHVGGNRRRRSRHDQRLVRPHLARERVPVQQAEQGATYLFLGILGVARADPLRRDLPYVLAHAEPDADARFRAHSPVRLNLRAMSFGRGVEGDHAMTLPEAATAVDCDLLGRLAFAGRGRSRVTVL